MLPALLLIGVAAAALAAAGGAAFAWHRRQARLEQVQRELLKEQLRQEQEAAAAAAAAADFAERMAALEREERALAEAPKPEAPPGPAYPPTDVLPGRGWDSGSPSPADAEAIAAVAGTDALVVRLVSVTGIRAGAVVRVGFRASGWNGLRIGQELKWPAALNPSGGPVLWGTVQSLPVALQSVHKLRVTVEVDGVLHARAERPLAWLWGGGVEEAVITLAPTAAASEDTRTPVEKPLVTVVLLSRPRRQRVLYVVRPGESGSGVASRGTRGLTEAGIEEAQELARWVAQDPDAEQLRRAPCVLAAACVHALQTALVGLRPLRESVAEVRVLRHACGLQPPPLSASSLMRQTMASTLAQMFTDPEDAADVISWPVSSVEADTLYAGPQWDCDDDAPGAAGDNAEGLASQLAHLDASRAVLVCPSSALRGLLAILLHPRARVEGPLRREALAAQRLGTASVLRLDYDSTAWPHPIVRAALLYGRAPSEHPPGMDYYDYLGARRPQVQRALSPATLSDGGQVNAGDSPAGPPGGGEPYGSEEFTGSTPPSSPRPPQPPHRQLSTPPLPPRRPARRVQVSPPRPPGRDDRAQLDLEWEAGQAAGRAAQAQRAALRAAAWETGMHVAALRQGAASVQRRQQGPLR